MVILLGASVQELSNVDVIGLTTTTFWTCGCFLRCPFCHNHLIASFHPSVCREFESENELRRWLESWMEAPTEWVHVTGGEPTMSPRAVDIIVEAARNHGKNVSINSNLIHSKAAELILGRWRADHVAFDIKIPISMTGMPRFAYKTLASSFVSNLMKIKDAEIPYEARIPVAREITKSALSSPGYRKLLSLLRDWEGVVRVQKLIHGVGGVHGWSDEWCRKHCNAEDDEVIEVAREVAGIVGREVFVYLPDKRQTIKIK